MRTGIDASECDVRRATAAYYGMVKTKDEYYRQVCEALERVGQNLDNWIIVYTSDHGEMLGQHGVWEQRIYFSVRCRSFND